MIDMAALIDAAFEVKKRSYSPYSQFAVGAALWCEDGSIVVGCNVENASYPVSLCAERAAVAAAVALGHRKFLALAVVAGQHPVTPCGACRQVLREFGEMTVFCAAADDLQHPEVYELSALLPHSFDLEASR
ncbi:MAG: cytidine deaminase [Sulfobacillus sp.]